MTDRHEEFERLLGRATFRLWADLPRDVQELIFEGAAEQDAVIRNDLAVYLHQHHPRSPHPLRPVAGR
jgi:hypothetical protein